MVGVAAAVLSLGLAAAGLVSGLTSSSGCPVLVDMALCAVLPVALPLAGALVARSPVGRGLLVAQAVATAVVLTVVLWRTGCGTRQTGSCAP